jgi:hypothetical protein
MFGCRVAVFGGRLELMRRPWEVVRREALDLEAAAVRGVVKIAKRTASARTASTQDCYCTAKYTKAKKKHIYNHCKDDQRH